MTPQHRAAVFGAVSAQRGEWNRSEACTMCGKFKSQHRPGEWLMCPYHEPPLQPLDWLSDANIWRLFEAVVAFHANSFEYASARMDRWFDFGKLSMKEAVLAEYCDINGISIPQEGASS